MEMQPVAIEILHLCRFIDSFSLIIDLPSESVWSGFHTRGQLSSSSRIPSSSSSSSQTLPVWEYYSKGVSTKINNSHWHQPFPQQVNVSPVKRLSWALWSICLLRKKNFGQKASQKLFPWSESLTKTVPVKRKRYPDCSFGMNALPRLSSSVSSWSALGRNSQLS